MTNDFAKIVLAVSHSQLTKVCDCMITKGIVNALKCEFQFRTADWDDTVKTAVFIRGNKPTVNSEALCVVLDQDNMCSIPYEMLCEDGYFSVGIYGTAKNYRIVSNWITYMVNNGAYIEGSTPVEPDQPEQEPEVDTDNTIEITRGTAFDTLLDLAGVENFSIIKSVSIASNGLNGGKQLIWDSSINMYRIYFSEKETAQFNVGEFTYDIVILYSDNDIETVVDNAPLIIT